MIKFFKTPCKDQELSNVQDNLIRTLNPVFDTPILGGVQLTSIVLAVGSNNISHKLSRNLIGWVITRQRAAASIYDTQDTNLTPQLSLKLTSDAIVTIDLYCY